MTKSDLKKTECLLEKIITEYGEEVSDDRYCSMVIMLETINSLILKST